MKAVKEIEKNQSGADEFPVWWDGKQLDESAFCEWFAYKHELMFVGSQFFDIDGILSEEKLSKEILEDIELLLLAFFTSINTINQFILPFFARFHKIICNTAGNNSCVGRQHH